MKMFSMKKLWYSTFYDLMWATQYTFMLLKIGVF